MFAGGWTLAAAETVCAAAGLEPRHVADDLAALVDKSLVVREGTRYRLLETLRQYGRERLRETGEAPAVRDAHLAWAVGLAEEAELHLDGLDQAAWLDALERELDNLRAALEWAITSRDAEAGLRLASVTTGSLWTWRSHVPEGQRWLERLLATPAEVSPSVRAKGLLAAGRVDFQAGRWPRGVELCAQSRDLYREVGEPAGEARALIWMAFNRWGTEDDDEIGEILAAAIEAARRAERPLETGIALGLTGTWWCLRDVDRAQELVEEGGRLLEHAGNPNWLAHSFEFRALVAYLRGDHRRARELLASALPALPPDRQPGVQRALPGDHRRAGGGHRPAGRRGSAPGCRRADAGGAGDRRAAVRADRARARRRRRHGCSRRDGGSHGVEARPRARLRGCDGAGPLARGALTGRRRRSASPGRSRRDGRSCMVTTSVKAAAAAGSCSATAWRRRT